VQVVIDIDNIIANCAGAMDISNDIGLTSAIINFPSSLWLVPSTARESGAVRDNNSLFGD
jgi:hypothetical protein